MVSCALALDVGTKRMVYNTGVSSFRRDDIILLRVEGQLVVAHGEHVCAYVRACMHTCVCACVLLYAYTLCD